MKKFILFSVLCSVSLLSNAQSNEQVKDSKQNEVALEINQIKTEHLMRGIIGRDNQRIIVGEPKGSSYYKQFNDACRVNMHIKKDGSVDMVLADEYLKHPFFKEALIEKFEEAFYIDFYSRYLIAACHFNEYEAPLSLTANPNANKALNLLYAHIDSSQGPSINSILQENYANALATIQLIIKFGANKDVLQTLKKASVLNDSQSILWKANGFFRSVSGTAIKSILLPENLEKINRISQNDSEKMEMFALEIANIATVYDISTLDDSLRSYLFDMENLNLFVAMKTYDLVKESVPEHFPNENPLKPKDVNSYVEIMPSKSIDYLRNNGHLGGIQNDFQALYAIDNSSDEFSKKKQELEIKIKNIIFDTIEKNYDFINWNISKKRTLSKELLVDIKKYNIRERLFGNKRKISNDELIEFALPELKEYKGLLSNQVSLDFYKAFKNIEYKIALKSNVDKEKLIRKYR